MPLISIVVPVYNVEKYLERCIKSILAQTFTDWECILVDDASPDSSPTICDKYIQKDKRIKVIHKEKNEGLPQARKTGFDNTIGDYILHVDSDDWIEKDMLEKMYNEAFRKDLDIVYCDYIVDSPKLTRFKNIEIEGLDKAMIIRHLLSYRIIWVVWNKLARRELYSDLVFPHGSFGEDAVISIQLFYFANSIGYIKNDLYHYSYNDYSLSNKSDQLKKRSVDLYNNFSMIIDFLKDTFGINISALEPELSNQINYIKTRIIRNNVFEKLKEISNLYPNAKYQIFNKYSNLPFYHKLLLYMAHKDILLPYRIFNFLFPKK
jgi:glycosyltransferase involved in cell wall biosynthesis